MVDYYEATRAQIADLVARRAATRDEALRSLRRPVPGRRRRDLSSPLLLKYLRDLGVLSREDPDLVTDLVEYHGGAWELVWPDAALVSSLAPDEVKLTEFRERYRDAFASEFGATAAAIAGALDELRAAAASVEPGRALLVHMH